jgi:diguanylate cyclase (GGDEF)-like protein/PAS domain S-box-containing protein
LTISNSLHIEHENLVMLTNATSRNLESPLVFKDYQGVNDILQSLKASSNINYADVKDANNKVIARYSAKMAKLKYSSFIDILPIQKNQLVSHPIILNNEVLGTLTVQEHLDYVFTSQISLVIQISLIFALTFLIALTFARRLSKSVIRPILQIATTAHNIEQGGDYTQRVNKSSYDETGYLADEFNKMLVAINQRDRALQESEFRWKFAIEGSGDGIWDWNIQIDEAMFSERWKGMLGYSGNEIKPTSKEWLNLIHPEDQQGVADTLQAYLEGKLDKYLIECRLKCKDGSYKWILARGMIVSYSEDGKPLRMLGTHTDISIHKETEQKILKSLSLLNATLESTNDAILVVDLNNTWVLYNSKFIELWHVTDEILSAKDDTVALAFVLDQLDDADAFIKKVLELYATPEATSFDTIKFKNGKIIERYSIPQVIEDKVVGRVWSFRDVTLSKLSEENLLRSQSALNESLDRYLDLYEFAPIGYLSLSKNGIIAEVNWKVTSLFGLPRTVLNQHPLEKFVAEEDKMHWQRTFANLDILDPGEEQRFDLKFTHNDGSIIIASVICIRMDDEIDPSMLRITLFDVTEIRLAEEKTAESHQLLRTIIDTAPVEIFWKDIESRYLGCNTAFAISAGYKQPDDIIGKVDSQLSWATEAEHYRTYDLEIIQSGVPSLHYEQSITMPDGSIHWDMTSKVPLKNQRNETIGLVGVDEDITDRKIAENDLRIAATAFEAQEGICVTDANNVILKVNHAFTAITGYSSDEAVGLTPRLLSSGHHGKEFYNNLWESVNNTGHWEGEIYNRRKNGEIYPQHLTITTVKDTSGVIANHVATLTDITMNKAAADEIEHLAFYDSLTHLPNRRLLLDRLNHALAASARNGRQGALLFLDLDHFKTLNDSRGHDVGDLLLQQVAERLTACVREGDTVARFGGDEFLVVLEDLSEQDLEAAAQAETIANKILTSLNQPYLLVKHRYHSTPSIGVTLFNDHQSSIEELLKQADIAMYQAKKAGRNSIRFFNPEMQSSITARVELEAELRKALEQHQFQLHYQIQIDNLGIPLGAEALIRWLHPNRGMISPFHFIPLAEETGLIIAIGQWVLDSACAQLKAWQQNSLTHDLTLSINVSAKQFHQTDFVSQIQSTIKHYGINPKLLKLELTESILLDSVEDTIASMTALGDIGVQFSLDDFGTGYSSLQYLKRLPLHQLKIDQSFVRDITIDSSDRSIVSTIIAMAHSLDLGVIAEGVETNEQWAFLLENGCQRYQGYLFGRPVSIEQFEEALKKGNRLPKALYDSGQSYAKKI